MENYILFILNGFEGVTIYDNKGIEIQHDLITNIYINKEITKMKVQLKKNEIDENDWNKINGNIILNTLHYDSTNIFQNIRF